MVVAWSQQSVESEYVRSEVEEGMRRRMLVPVLIDDVLPPLAHRRQQAANLTTWTGARDHEYETLIAGIHAILARPPTDSNQRPAETTATPTPRIARSRRREFRTSLRMAVGIGAVCVLVGAAIALVISRFVPSPIARTPKRANPSALTIRTTIELPADAPLIVGGRPPLIGFPSTVLALSPYGRFLAYVGETRDGGHQIFLRDLTRYGFEPVAGTQNAIFPFFSPNSQWLGFLTNDRVKKIAVSRGALITIADANTPVFAAWKPNDKIYVAEAQGHSMTEISLEGGPATRLLMVEIQAKTRGLPILCRHSS